MPPLRQATTSSSFIVELSWVPISIEPNQPVTIFVKVRDVQESVVKDTRYDLLITDAEGKPILDIKNYTPTLGKGIHEITSVCWNSTCDSHIPWFVKRFRK